LTKTLIRNGRIATAVDDCRADISIEGAPVIELDKHFTTI
jgi:hypothetical protein